MLEEMYRDVKIGDKIRVVKDGCFLNNDVEECLNEVTGTIIKIKEVGRLTISIDKEFFDEFNSRKYDLFRKYGDEFVLLRPRQSVNW